MLPGLPFDDLIHKIKFFENESCEGEILQREENHVVLRVNGTDYDLWLYPMEDYQKLELADRNHLEIENTGFAIDRTLDLGLFPEYHMAYQLTRKHKRTSMPEYLRGISSEERIALGETLGQCLKNLHSMRVKNEEGRKTGKDYETRINLVLYQHGLLRDMGKKDYILVDFIMNQRHILKNILHATLVGEKDFSNWYLNEEGTPQLSNGWELQTGDVVSDFVFLNAAAHDFPEFANAVLYSYFDGNPPRKFFRLYALYTAVDLLDKIVEVNTSTLRGEEKDWELQKVQNVIADFEDFSCIVPKWYEYRDAE